MATRKAAPKLRRTGFGNKPIKYLPTLRCDEGHEFGIDLDKLGQFYGRIPETIRCPHPKCGIAVLIKQKKENT